MNLAKNVIAGIIESLKEIASQEFQLKGWVRGEIHEYCTFVETMCGLFDDLSIEYVLKNEAERWGLSQDQIQKLDRLRIALDIYTRKHSCYEDPLIIVKDPEWHKIRMMAKECLQSFNIEKYLDPSKSIFKNSLLYSISVIARPEFQERIWIKERRPNGNPFQELVKKFFGFCKVKDIIEDYKDYEISDEQVQILIKLSQALEDYWKKSKDQEDLQVILQDPEWHHIQKLAQKTLEVFQFNPDA